MCTAVTYKTKNTYFGRTLDLEYHYREEVVVTPRNFPLAFRTMGELQSHYAIIGMATVADGYPLYYDAANEHGLAVAGLNFPGFAHYFDPVPDKDNIAPFELIPWILAQCKNLSDVWDLLKKINICSISFSREFPLSPLHWMIADRENALTVESVAEGLKIYENPVGVLTNNPPFDYQMLHLCDYLNLTPYEPENRFGLEGLTSYSRGMGAMGLPGDLSSASRFVRAAFTKANSVSGSEEEGIAQFFHILGTVAQTRGCVRMPDGRYEITQYTACIDLDRGIYCYNTYENPSIRAVSLCSCDLHSHILHRFPVENKLEIKCQNNG